MKNLIKKSKDLENAEDNFLLAQKELEVARQKEYGVSSLDDFRNENKTKDTFVFALITIAVSVLYFWLNDVILVLYPDAGVHAIVTLHKAAAVLVFMLLTELSLIGLEKIKDNYLSRYGDSNKFLLLDKINDFYNAKPETRLWLKFAYFALRFYCAISLAGGNLI